ncbi:MULTISPECIES: hybrid sensor histidine kinase/response regulator [Cyanophyceae]|uniref:hybrid sensor histidine kinase/response regulator n=1 Tax=Cyanophyceae TaxID=3028117 RepID=UPI0016822611|nr:ATP-binding protein [Coleofasciculus sp. FACHB-125]MBD1899401.1 hybrid sensor histidine kinase/response regulator [Coleofasciculus sp. FACHB-125]
MLKETESASSLEQPLTVLLVDDQALVGVAIRRMLATEEDIIFHYCSEPTQAIQMATEVAPTVILQDLVMPEINGLLLVRFFRANSATRDVPIIVLSAKEDPAVKAEAFALDVNDYLIKLPDKIELIARIRYHSKAYINFIKQARLHAQVEAQVEMLSEKSRQLTEALTQLQNTQARLIQSEKMASLGQLVAGVVHAINNPVNFIYGNLTYLDEYTQALLDLLVVYQQEYPQPSLRIQEQAEEIDLNFLIEDLPRMLSSMKVGADRICQIVSSLRNFSRLDESAMKPVNIHEGIESTLLILQHRLKAKTEHSGIQILKEYGNLPPVECYAGQLNQVFLNILSNAIDALNDYDKERSPDEIRNHPSRIVIQTSIVSTQGSAVSEHTTDNQTNNQQDAHGTVVPLVADKVAIRIIDNGPGIASEVKSRIFNSFFTTKNVERETGLGLAISYQIVVEKHGGSLQCFSEPGKGTEFAIEIPIQQPAHQSTLLE